MTNHHEYHESQTICNEIGEAVLEVLGNQRALTVQFLIETLLEAKNDEHRYGVEREQGMEMAINILKRFT